MLWPFSGYQEHIVAPYPFLWSSNFSCGNEDVDEKHKIVFRTINTLLQCDGVPSALECLIDLQKAVEELFSAEESYMELLLREQRGFSENFTDRRGGGDDDSSRSTLASDHKAENDRRGLRYVHPASGKVFELEGIPVSEQSIDQHSTKHQQFLEDMESIRRRLEFNATTRRFEDDADFRGKRELEYIANWYIHHVTLDDAPMRVSNLLCEKLRDRSSSGPENIESQDRAIMDLANTKPKLMVKFQTSSVATITRHEPLKDSELETLRQHPNLIFTRDWLAFIQEEFIAGICLLRLPQAGHSSRIVMANAVWTELTRLYPWLAAKAEYEKIADGGDVLNLRKNTSTGSCWIRKQKFFGGDNIYSRVISIAVPVKVSSELFDTRGNYVADLSFFLPREFMTQDHCSVISSAFARQRSALLSKSYLGDLESQTLSSSNASLGWQHAPIGTSIFDNLLAWLATSLLIDKEWMANEFPGVRLALDSEVIDSRETELIIVLREGVAACLRAKTEAEQQSSNNDSQKLLHLPPKHAISHLSGTSEEIPSAIHFDAARDSPLMASSYSPATLAFKSHVKTDRVLDDSGDDSEPSEMTPHSSMSSQDEVPLNHMIQSFGTPSMAGGGMDEAPGRNQEDVVRDLANELGDLKKYMQPSKNQPEKVSRKAKKPHRGRRKRLMD